MPRSSKAPPLPPEPDINELIQNDVARIKRLLGLDVNRLALGSEVEGIVTGGVYGSNDYTITGVNTIELVNVSTSLGPSQGGSGFPAQVTGLTITPHAGSDTQLDLTWTATSLPAEFNYYNVYRGPVGFTVDPSFIIAQPITNSYNNTGLTAGTTYYYRVSITNDAMLEGPASPEVSRTTTGTPPSTANIWLKFDGNYTDSSGLGNTVNSNNTSGFAGSGQFGTNSVVVNVAAGKLDYVAVPDNTNTALDLVNGFSYSCWIYITATDANQYILSKQIDASNFVGLWLFGTTNYISVDIREAGTFKSIKTPAAISSNAWHHVVLTYDGTNPKLYLDKVLSTTASASNFQPTGTTDLIVGGLAGDTNLSGGGNGKTFRGRIDELQYFKGVVLTQTQVNNLFATNAP